MDQKLTKKNIFMAVVNPSFKRDHQTRELVPVNNNFEVKAYDYAEALKLARVELQKFKIKERKFIGVKQITF